MTYDATAKDIGTERRKKTTRFLKERGQGRKKDAEETRKSWVTRPLEHQVPYLSNWSNLAIPSHIDLQHMVSRIPNSWAIQFSFTLATPYLSKGIEAFDLLDNPIIRDKVYEVPLVPASSWKGGLRAAAATVEVVDAQKNPIEKDDREKRIIRLFGNERKEESGFHAGRLHCFPTGFQKTACEIINPHDRARRVGTNPILLECVPAGEPGIFTVLYVPFGVESDAATCGQDLELCVAAISSLLREWGIGAKKSNGNGLAKDMLSEAAVLPHPPHIEMAPQKKQRQQGKLDLTNFAGAMQERTGDVVIDTFQKLIKEAERVALFLKGQTK